MDLRLVLCCVVFKLRMIVMAVILLMAFSFISINFLEWKLFWFYPNCIEICFQWSSLQPAIIGSDNDLLPVWQRTTICTSVGLVYNMHYASLDLGELICTLNQWAIETSVVIYFHPLKVFIAVNNSLIVGMTHIYLFWPLQKCYRLSVD